MVVPRPRGYLTAVIVSSVLRQERWSAATNIEDDTLAIISDTGYSDDVLCLQWIKHFERFTTKRRIVNGVYFYSTVTVHTAQEGFLISAAIATSFHSAFLHMPRISWE